MSGRIAFFCWCEEEALLWMRLPYCFNFPLADLHPRAPLDLPGGSSPSSSAPWAGRWQLQTPGDHEGGILVSQPIFCGDKDGGRFICALIPRSLFYRTPLPAGVRHWRLLGNLQRDHSACLSLSLSPLKVLFACSLLKLKTRKQNLGNSDDQETHLFGNAEHVFPLVKFRAKSKAIKQPPTHPHQAGGIGNVTAWKRD